MKNDQEQEVPTKEKNMQKAYNLKDYSKLTREELIQTALNYEMENRRLKNKLAEHQPFKQKVIREPNQPKLNKLF